MPMSSSVRMVCLRRSPVRSAAIRSKYEPESRGSSGSLGLPEREVEVLHLGRHEEAEAPLAGVLQRAAQHVAGVTLERAAVEVEDVAEHPGGHGRRRCARGSSWKVLGSGMASTSRLLDPAEAVDGRPVEGHALLQGVLELGGRDVEVLGRAEDVA